MGIKKHVGILCGLVALTASLPVWAQGAEAAPAANSGGARTHDGFYLNLGLNLGYAMMTESYDPGAIPDLELKGVSNGFDLLLGGTPVPGLVIGGGIVVVRTGKPSVKQGNLDGELDGTMLLAGVTGFGQYYFDPNEGLFLQAMLGFAALDYVQANGSSNGNDPTGFMLGVGVGYDFWIGDEWSVGPVGRVLYASTSVEDRGAKASETYFYPSIGVAFTLH